MQGSISSEKFLTIEELSKCLKVSKYTIYAWVRKKSIPFCKLNGLVRFETDRIEEWLDENRSEGMNNKKQNERRYRENA